MKLARYTPAGLSRLSDFDSFFRSPLGSVFDGFFGSPGSAQASSSRLATDLFEDANNFYARFEVPGVKKEDVKLDLNQKLLTVSVEKREKKGDAEQSYSLSRSVSVPDSVDAGKIAAKLEDGVLTVTLPKAEERKARSIQIA